VRHRRLVAARHQHGFRHASTGTLLRPRRTTAAGKRLHHRSDLALPPADQRDRGTDSSISVAWSGWHGAVFGYRVFPGRCSGWLDMGRRVHVHGLSCDHELPRSASVRSAGPGIDRRERRSPSAHALTLPAASRLRGADRSRQPALPRRRPPTRSRSPGTPRPTTSRSPATASTTTSPVVDGHERDLLHVRESFCGAVHRLAVDASDAAGTAQRRPRSMRLRHHARSPSLNPIAGQGYRLVFGTSSTRSTARSGTTTSGTTKSGTRMVDLPDSSRGELDLTSSRNFFWGTCSTCNWPINTVSRPCRGEDVPVRLLRSPDEVDGINGAWPRSGCTRTSTRSTQTVRPRSRGDRCDGQARVSSRTSSTGLCTRTRTAAHLRMTRTGNNWQAGRNRPKRRTFHTYGALWNLRLR
jgi:hypothetical protein